MRIRIPIWMLLVGLFLAGNYVWGLFHPRRTRHETGVQIPATVFDADHPYGYPGSARVGAITPGSGLSPIGDQMNHLGAEGKER